MFAGKLELVKRKRKVL